MGVFFSRYHFITLGEAHVYHNHQCSIGSTVTNDSSSQEEPHTSTPVVAAKEKIDQSHRVNLSHHCLARLDFSALGSLKHMTSLYLDHNDLGTLPDAIGTLSQLRKLSVACTRLTSLPDSLTQLPKLYALNLSHNGMEELPNVLGKLPSLRKLYVNNNQIQAIPPRLAKDLCRLVLLDVQNNPLSTLPGELRLSETLKLRVHGCCLIDTFPEQRLQPPSLMELSARAVARHKIPYDGVIAQVALHYLSDQQACTVCHAIMFKDYITQILFDKREGAKIPFEYQLCSPHTKRSNATLAAIL